MKYLTVPLDSNHRKKVFSCGKKMLDNYLHNQAGQDVRRKLSACFVLEEKETGLIHAYYTLANNSIPIDLVPAIFKKKFPKSYSSVPTTLIGRLAVDNNHKSKGIGKLLLIDALKRSFQASKTIGSIAIIVDPLDDDAEEFYTKYGFIKLPDSGKMFLPMQTVGKLFEQSNNRIIE